MQVNNMYKKTHLNQKKLKVRGICLHEIGNQFDAKTNAKLIEQMTGYSVHYIVDEKRQVRTQRTDLITYHTGKGFDYGNKHYISIEICDGGFNNAIELIKELMKKYKLTVEDVYFHQSFNPTFYCPANILRKYGNLANFRKELSAWL